jgi:hypothetical protein
VGIAAAFPAFGQGIVPRRVNQFEGRAVAIGFIGPGEIIIIMHCINQGGCFVVKPEQFAASAQTISHWAYKIVNLRKQIMKSHHIVGKNNISERLNYSALDKSIDVKVVFILKHPSRYIKIIAMRIIKFNPVARIETRS